MRPRPEAQFLGHGQGPEPLGEVFVHLFVGGGQVFFERQQVVSFTRHNQVSVGALASGRVAADRGLPQIQGPQQVGNARFFVALGPDFLWPRTK